MSATLDGQPCSEAEITIPRYGVPWGRCEMTDADAIPAVGSQVLLTIASLPMVCTVIEAGERGGVASLELVGGYGGWHRAPEATASYRNDAGVNLAEAAGKLSAAVGERLIAGAVASRSVGPHLSVAGGPDAPAASASLSELCALPEGAPRVRWYVDLDGSTRLGERLPLPEVDATEVDRDPRAAWLAFAEEDAASLLPGATIGGRQIAELRITAKPDQTREVVTLEGDEPQSFAARFWRLVVDIVRPFFLWRTVYTYRVTRVRAGNRIDAVPAANRYAPELEAVRVWPGVGGNITKPKVGAKCLVTFADGRPTAPVIVGWQPQLATSDAKWRPERADYDADQVVIARGTKPAGRGGWSVTMSPPAPPAPPPPGSPLVITFTDPDGVPHVFNVFGLAGVNPVAFVAQAGAGVDPTVSAVIDAGRPEVLV